MFLKKKKKKKCPRVSEQHPTDSCVHDMSEHQDHTPSDLTFPSSSGFSELFFV